MKNEKRLIYADEVKNYFLLYGLQLDASTIRYINASIDRIPTADAVEVRHGQWDNDGNCSCCGKNIYDDIDADMWSRYAPPYCPNCDAKMDGGNHIQKEI